MKPSLTRSACICFSVRRCLRGLPISVFSQPASFSEKGSSLLGRSGVANFGSIVFAARCFDTVLRERPVRRAISRIDSFSRKCMRRMMFKSPMWITPLPPPLTAMGEGSHGSLLSGNYALTRLSSGWKSTPASSQPVPHGARPARRTSAPFGYHGSGHEGSSSATAVTMAFAMARPMGKSPNNSDHRRRMHKHGRGIAHFCQPCRKIGFSCLKTLYPCLHRPVIWLVLGSGHESRVLCLGPRQGLAGGAFDCKNRGLFLSLGVDDFTVRHFESS